MSSSDSSFSVMIVSTVLVINRSTGERLTLNLLLNLGLLSAASSSSSTTRSSGGGTTTTGADVGKKVLHVLALESL